MEIGHSLGVEIDPDFQGIKELTGCLGGAKVLIFNSGGLYGVNATWYGAASKPDSSVIGTSLLSGDGVILTLPPVADYFVRSCGMGTNLTLTRLA